MDIHFRQRRLVSMIVNPLIIAVNTHSLQLLLLIMMVILLCFNFTYQFDTNVKMFWSVAQIYAVLKDI